MSLLVTENTLNFFYSKDKGDSKQFHLITAVISLPQCRKAVYHVDGEGIYKHICFTWNEKYITWRLN